LFECQPTFDPCIVLRPNNKSVRSNLKGRKGVNATSRKRADNFPFSRLVRDSGLRELLSHGGVTAKGRFAHRKTEKLKPPGKKGVFTR